MGEHLEPVDILGGDVRPISDDGFWACPVTEAFSRRNNKGGFDTEKPCQAIFSGRPNCQGGNCLHFDRGQTIC